MIVRATNLIHGLTLDVQYDGDVDTGESLTEWLRAVLLPVVDSVLAQHDRQGQVCRIERLEIDLGTIMREEAEDELARLLQAQLADALRWPTAQSAQLPAPTPSRPPVAGLASGPRGLPDAASTVQPAGALHVTSAEAPKAASFGGPAGAPVEVRSEALSPVPALPASAAGAAAAGVAPVAAVAGAGEGPEAQLLQFLRSGRLPWSIAADQHAAHEQLLRRVLAMPSATTILRSVVQDQQMVTRLVRQYDAALLQVVATMLHADHPRPPAGAETSESDWIAVLLGAAQASAHMDADPALTQFRNWTQRRLELAEQRLSLSELHQWLIWWLMHDSTLVNQDCGLMLNAINSQCTQAPDPVQFMKLVLATLREGKSLDLDALLQQSAEALKAAPLDAITTLKSHQAIRNFIGQHSAERAELDNLNSAQLHQLVRGWIGDTSSDFLAAIENHALQAGDVHAYFRHVLQSLVEDRAIDLESLTAPNLLAHLASPAPLPPAQRERPTQPAQSPQSSQPSQSSQLSAQALESLQLSPQLRAQALDPSQLSPQSLPTGSTASQPASARSRSPLSAMLQQSLPQRLANAMLQADLSSLETIWPEITRFHADVLLAATQRYLRRPQERAHLIARSTPDMLIAMLHAIAPAAGELAGSVLRHAESCNAVLPDPLAGTQFQQCVLEFAFRQALDAGQGGSITSLIDSLLPQPAAQETVQLIAHAWRAILPPVPELERVLYGGRYLQAIQQRLQDDDDAVTTLHVMLVEEVWMHYPKLLDPQLREQLMASDLAAFDAGGVVRGADTTALEAGSEDAGIPPVAGYAGMPRNEAASASPDFDVAGTEPAALKPAATASREAHIVATDDTGIARSSHAARSMEHPDTGMARTVQSETSGMVVPHARHPAMQDGKLPLSAAKDDPAVLKQQLPLPMDRVGEQANSGVAAPDDAVIRGRQLPLSADCVAAPSEFAPVPSHHAAAEAYLPLPTERVMEQAGIVAAASDDGVTSDEKLPLPTDRVKIPVESQSPTSEHGKLSEQRLLSAGRKALPAARVAKPTDREALPKGRVAQPVGPVMAHAAFVAAPSEHASALEHAPLGDTAEPRVQLPLPTEPSAGGVRAAAGHEDSLVGNSGTSASGDLPLTSAQCAPALGVSPQAVPAPIDAATLSGTAAHRRIKIAAEIEAPLAVLLMRAEPLGQVEHLAAELLLQRLLRKTNGAPGGTLETALSQPAAIARLTELAPAPVLAELLIRLQPALAGQLPSILRALASKVPLVNVTAMQNRNTWRAIYQAAFVAADPVTPAEFIRTLMHDLGGSDLTLPPVVAAGATPQAMMRDLLRPLNTRQQPEPAAAQAEEEPAATSGDSNIRNAGMVIIATYAQRLFSLLELTKDGQFVSEEAAQRAVHLLQYAVTGASATPEYQLVLNKLLCGIHGGQPIARGIDLTDKERDTIEQMLNGVIAHWKALGKTSIAGLRQTFLQREGHLYFEDEAWHLKIPVATFDMLLDRLPWSFAMIRFPWMEHPLRVTWR